MDGIDDGNFDPDSLFSSGMAISSICSGEETSEESNVDDCKK